MTRMVLLVLALVLQLASPAPAQGFHFYPGADLDTSRVAWIAPSLGDDLTLGA